MWNVETKSTVWYNEYYGDIVMNWIIVTNGSYRYETVPYCYLQDAAKAAVDEVCYDLGDKEGERLESQLVSMGLLIPCPF